MMADPEEVVRVLLRKHLDQLMLDIGEMAEADLDIEYYLTRQFQQLKGLALALQVAVQQKKQDAKQKIE